MPGLALWHSTAVSTLALWHSGTLLAHRFPRRASARWRVRAPRTHFPCTLRALPVRMRALLCPFSARGSRQCETTARANSPRLCGHLAPLLSRRKKYRNDRHLRTQVRWPPVAPLPGPVALLLGAAGTTRFKQPRLRRSPPTKSYHDRDCAKGPLPQTTATALQSPLTGASS